MTTYTVNDTYNDTIETFNTYDDAIEYCQQSDIIYHYKATEYLLENDPSLRDSLEAAIEYGFTLESINSETLATIHYQDALINSIEKV